MGLGRQASQRRNSPAAGDGASEVRSPAMTVLAGLDDASTRKSVTTPAGRFTPRWRPESRGCSVEEGKVAADP